MSLFLISFIGFAENVKPVNNILPTVTKYGNWIFTGVVKNESGENYAYFFQIHRANDTFKTLAAIVESQSKEVIMYDESSAVIKNTQQRKQQVGRSFFSFNPINESWVFGLQTKDNKGFNFKVDMLSQTGRETSSQDLRTGVKLLVNQTGRINGHINLGKDRPEEFVTGDKAWFRQVWLTEEQAKAHPFSSLLCLYNDGGGFYSINLKEEDAHDGAVTGYCDADGMPVKMSQFLDIEESQNGAYHIHIPAPAMDIELAQAINGHNLLAGFISKGANDGFCMLSQDRFGDEIPA